MGKTISLIEYLHYKVGCDYISDLKHLGMTDRITLLYVMYKITPEEFTLKEWNEALTYILNEEPCETPIEAHERFIDTLK